MSKKTNTLLMIICTVLGLTGMGLLIWSMLDDTTPRWVLAVALACTTTGLFLSSYRLAKHRKSSN
jgi:hypothetical protein